MKRYVKLFRHSQMLVNGGMIQCENNACFSASVSQVFVGKACENWLLSGECPERGLNIELNSGSLYSFLSENEDFLNETYRWICHYLSAAATAEKWLIDFENSSILNISKTEKEDDLSESEAELLNYRDGTVRGELKQLIAHCKFQKDLDEQILPLLLEIDKNTQNQIPEVQTELYRKMIGLSLIDLCNELGLNLLLSEIKSRVYH